MIIDHPRLRHNVDLGVIWGSEPNQVVECDFCRKLCEGTGHNAGEAADAARKYGFKPAKDPENPTGEMKWTCGCHSQEK